MTTNRERFLKTIRFEKVDHPPLTIGHGWPETQARWQREGMVPAENMAHLFGLEEFHTYNCGIKTRFCPVFERRVLRETDTELIVVNEQGITERNIKSTMSMPEWIDYPVKSLKDVEALRPRLDPSNPERFPPGWEAVVQNFRRSRDIVVYADGGSFYGLLRNLMGVENVSFAFFEAPEILHTFNRMLCDCICSLLERTLGATPVDYLFFWEDLAFKNGPLLSPQQFREFCLPYYKEVMAVALRHGVTHAFVDSDGNIDAIIPLWLEAGVQCMFPLEVAAGMDPRRLRKQYGRDLVMWGGIDKRALAAGREAIDRELTSKVPELIETGGFIPAVDHSVPPDVSWANFTYFVEVLKEICGA